MSERKTTLNDKIIDRLPFSGKGQYIVRDADLPGFFLIIGVRRKTFTVQAEFRRHGVRHTTRRALGTSADLTTRDARIMAKQVLARIASGDFAEQDIATKAANVTLGEAWDRYKIALERKDRSAATIAGYQDHVERVLKDWMKLPLKTLGENPRMVSDRHDKITRVSGPSAANGCMRTLRAVYNHARRSARMLPPDNPTMAVDWNEEKRRDTAMGSFDLPVWMDEAGRLRHLIRREFHLFTLLSGSRPGALKRAELKHFDFARRVLHLPRPKGRQARLRHPALPRDDPLPGPRHAGEPHGPS
jgi:hypothetical protein